MNIVPVHGKCVYRKGLIVQNWEHIKWKFVTETCCKPIQIGIVEHLEIEFSIDLSNAHSVLTICRVDNLSAKTLNLPGI